MSDMQEARDRMVDRQLVRRGVDSPGVLEAMRRVPREAFVPDELAESAYDDSPLPIEDGQTISQPYIVGLMAQAAGLSPDDRVLDIGTGSGYAAAVLAQMAAHVDTVERHPGLAETAERRLRGLGYGNIDVHVADGTLGWPPAAPFDAILAAAGGPRVPPSWRAQLVVGGRLVMPVGPATRRQRLVKITRRGEDDYDEEDLGGVMFVPLIGEQGWAEARDCEARDGEARDGDSSTPSPASTARRR